MKTQTRMKLIGKRRISDVQQLQAIVFWITLCLFSVFSIVYLLN